MKYILVKDGQIQSYPREVPNVWENISNFNVLDNEQLKTFGWYPYRFAPVDLSDDMVSNGSYMVIEESEVVEYQSARPKTQDEKNIEIENLWESIRSQRDTYLNQSDWTQINDSPLSEIHKNNWRLYRQELRNITNQEDPYTIIWPTKPKDVQLI